MDKRHRNYNAREGVQYNNWHLRPGQMAQLAAAPKASGSRSQADISFQRDTKIARAVAAEQQRYEKAWLAEKKASTAAVQAQTMAKKWKNYNQREEVQYNNWHLRPGQI